MAYVGEKYKGKSFAEAAEAIAKKYLNRASNSIAQQSYDAEIGELMRIQERTKLRSQASSILKYGGKIKYDNGGIPLAARTASDLYKNIFENQVDPLPQIQKFVSPTVPQTLPTETKPISFESSNPLDNIHLPTDGGTSTTNPTSSPPTSQKFLSNDYAPALLGQGLSTALNIGLLLGGPDKAAPVTNPYESQVKRLMADRGIDNTAIKNQIMSQFSAARQQFSNVRSPNLQRALDANLNTQTARSLEDSMLKQEIANQGFKGEFASVLNNLGQQRVQADTLSQEINRQNKGQFRSELSRLGVSVADSGKFFTRMRLNESANELMSNILDQKYQDFGIDMNAVSKFIKGNYSNEDLVRLKNASEQYPELKEILTFAEHSKK